MLKINNLKSVLYSRIYFLLRIYFSCICFPPAKQRSPRRCSGVVGCHLVRTDTWQSPAFPSPTRTSPMFPLCLKWELHLYHLHLPQLCREYLMGGMQKAVPVGFISGRSPPRHGRVPSCPRRPVVLWAMPHSVPCPGLGSGSRDRCPGWEEWGAGAGG